MIRSALLMLSLLFPNGGFADEAKAFRSKIEQLMKASMGNIDAVNCNRADELSSCNAFYANARMYNSRISMNFSSGELQAAVAGKDRFPPAVYQDQLNSLAAILTFYDFTQDQIRECFEVNVDDPRYRKKIASVDGFALSCVNNFYYGGGPGPISARPRVQLGISVNVAKDNSF